MTTEELTYSLTLAHVPEIGVSKYKALTSRFGNAKNVFDQPLSVLAEVNGISETTAQRILDAKEDLDVAAAQILVSEQMGIDIVMCNDEKYPSKLNLRRNDAPKFIYTKGECDLETRKILAVVGTRKASPLYKEICDTIITELAQKHPDLVIISGLAEGIDISAHTSAINNGLTTIAVLPLPLNKIYPTKNVSIANEIPQNGMIISEFEFYSSERKENFVTRNRIIAALSDALLVVESKEDGGSMRTADYAIECDVPVGAVVGGFGKDNSQGCNKLIKEGKASLVSRTQDVERLLGYVESKDYESKRPSKQTVIPSVEAPKPEIKTVPTHDTSALADDARKVFETIARNGGSMYLDDLSNELDMSVNDIIDILFDLELDGYVAQKSGNLYQIQ